MFSRAKNDSNILKCCKYQLTSYELYMLCIFGKYFKGSKSREAVVEGRPLNKSKNPSKQK